MIERAVAPVVRAALGRQAAVALLGPRQVGKTTLALEIARQSNAVYLDLQRVSDRAKLTDPSAYLSQLEDRLVILDEVHRTPDLFPILRGVMDEGRRRGHRTGRFLILGSASTELLRQSGESLAGRITYLDLGPIHPGEVGPGDDERLWVRGAFPWHHWPHETTEDEHPAETQRCGAMRKNIPPTLSEDSKEGVPSPSTNRPTRRPQTCEACHDPRAPTARHTPARGSAPGQRRDTRQPGAAPRGAPSGLVFPHEKEGGFSNPPPGPFHAELPRR